MWIRIKTIRIQVYKSFANSNPDPKSDLQTTEQALNWPYHQISKLFVNEILLQNETKTIVCCTFSFHQFRLKFVSLRVWPIIARFCSKRNDISYIWNGYSEFSL